MKEISYKGKVVFQKKYLPAFKRKQREFAANEACFAFIDGGQFVVRDQMETTTVDSEHGLLARCTNYFYEDSSYPERAQNVQAIGIFLYPDIFQDLFGYDFTKSTYSVESNIRQVVLDRLLETFRDSISLLLDEPDLADELLIESKLREFVLLMTKRTDAPSELDFLASMFKPNFAKFEEVIQANLYADLNVDELAALCHMSVSTFKRKFSDVYGEPPMKHITKLKIEKAKSLLQHSERRISDIVFDTGFESISTFNRAFKSHTGKSPSDWRISG